MKKFSFLKKIHFAGFVFTCIAGSLLHFVYDWTGQNKVAAVFAATNESTWEHLKLLWIPILLFSLFEFFAYGRKQKNFLPIKYLSAVLGMTVITVVFYTYSGIIGKSFIVADILLFYIAAALSWRFSYKYMQTERFSSPFAVPVCRVLAALTAVCFVVWSFSPPGIGIFMPPV